MVSRGARGAVLAIALGGGVLAVSCSAGVDGFHLQEALSSSGGAGGQGGNLSGGSTPSGGSGGDASTQSGGTAGAGGATGGTGGATGGAGGATGGAGGATGGAGGATGGAGGATGGAGGATGGAGGAGGATGGAGGATGGAGGATGGAGGATPVWPATPKLVTLDSSTLAGITAAAWDAKTPGFFLLEPANHQLWQVDPSTGHVSGPIVFQAPATAGAVASRVLGLSDTTAFVVVDAKLYLVNRTTGATISSFPLSGSPSLPNLSGAHAGSTFFMGNATGSTYVLADGASVFTSSTLTSVGSVTTDGTGFAFRMLGGSLSYVHQTASSPILALATPCGAGALGQNTDVISVLGNTVSWVGSDGLNTYWHVATVSPSACTEASSSPVIFGQPTAGPFPVGLIGSSDALVAQVSGGSTAKVQLINLVSGPDPATLSVTVGLGGATAFVVASGPMPHYAVLVGNVPRLIAF